MSLLAPDEPHPVILVNEAASSPVVLVCEHAGRVVPRALGNLGLGEADLSRHIAWDIGAEAVSRRLSQKLDATLILQRYTRLAYDCNRPPDHPGAMPELSELTPIPGNVNLSAAERLARTSALYEPFHAAVRAVLDAKADPVFVTIHSFTRHFKGMVRDVELGLLHHADDRLARRLQQLMGELYPGIDTRINEPYGPGDGVAHTLDLHGNSRGITNVMIEIRNDLIADQEGQAIWAGLLAELIAEATQEKEQT
jgi:predicted N-formylglutamate amidohydrolase